MSKNIIHKQQKGFTLVEILVSLTIFVIITLISVSAFVQIIMAQRKADIARSVYEEANFLLEKIVKEIRNNTIDYAFYYLEQNRLRGFNYYDYLKEPPFRSNALVKIPSQQDVLAMISPDGKTRTLFWHDGDPATGSDQPADPDPNRQEYKLWTKKMTYLSGALPTTDSLRTVTTVPTPTPATPFLALPKEDPFKPQGFTGGIMNWGWYAAPPYQDTAAPSEKERIHQNWVAISSPRVNIASLRFLLWPQQDPYQFWDTSTNTDPGEQNSLLQQQSQPYVTIILQVVPTSSRLSGIPGLPPIINLQTTVSARLYQPVPYQGWPSGR